MDEREILEKIVVAISRDGNTRCGTGFYVSEDKVATCYHVLNPDAEKTKFWIKQDESGVWIEAWPIKCCPPPDDIAILQSVGKIDEDLGSIFTVFDAPSEFKSKGYDVELEKFGATWVSGNIEGPTYLMDYGASRRLQLSTPVKAVKNGRSGSPVFSLSQKRIVGMIDYRKVEMHRDADIVTAIPIETIIPLAISAKSIHIEEDPHDLQRRIADRIYYRRNKLNTYMDALLLVTDKEKQDNLNACIEKIRTQLDADTRDSIMIQESVAKSAHDAEDQDKQSRD